MESDPFGIAFTPNSKFAYLANSGNDTVSVIDTASKTVVSTIGIPPLIFGSTNQPIGLAVRQTSGTNRLLMIPPTRYMASLDEVTITETAIMRGSRIRKRA